jgi:hypothetical protein
VRLHRHEGRDAGVDLSEPFEVVRHSPNATSVPNRGVERRARPSRRIPEGPGAEDLRASDSPIGQRGESRDKLLTARTSGHSFASQG